MAWTKVADFAVDGHNYEIKLDTGSGKFFCLDEDEQIEAPSLNTLKDKLRKRTRGAKVEIPVTMADGDDDADGDLEHGVILGVHGRTGRIMFREDGGSYTRQIYSGQKFRRRFTPEDAKKFKELATARDLAQAALDDWLEERAIDVGEALADARKAAEAKA